MSAITPSSTLGTPMYGPSGPGEKAMTSLGFKTWTAPMASWGAAVAMTAGTLYLTPCYFDAGTVVNRFTIFINPVGSGVTLARWGVYGYNSKQLLASSADVSSMLNSGATAKDIALSAPWTAPTGGLYLAGLLQVGGTPASIPGTLPASIGAGPGWSFGVGQAGLSDLPNPVVTTNTNRYLHFAAS